MAIGMTYNKRQEKQNQTQGKIGSAYPYQGQTGVSQNTANNLGNFQSGYTPSAQVQSAQDYLDAVQAQKPQGYKSKYEPMLEGILQKIQNPEKFKYEFNGDEMFKNYADVFGQKAKQMSMDTMGQAAALTGGYGNTYAQQAGAQAYQQAMLPLYDVGMDLANAAYSRFRDEQGDIKDAYNYLKDADTTDYGRYQDELARWQNERIFAAGRYDTERQMDQNQYNTDRDYWTGMAAQENAAMQNDRTLAAQYALSILQNGQMPSADLLRLAGLSEADAAKLMAQIQAGGGGRGKKNSWIESVAIPFIENAAAGLATGAAGTGNTANSTGAAKNAIINSTNKAINNATSTESLDLINDMMDKYEYQQDTAQRVMEKYGDSLKKLFKK